LLSLLFRLIYSDEITLLRLRAKRYKALSPD
jgi:hypothetical protein